MNALSLVQILCTEIEKNHLGQCYRFNRIKGKSNRGKTEKKEKEENTKTGGGGPHPEHQATTQLRVNSGCTKIMPQPKRHRKPV